MSFVFPSIDIGRIDAIDLFSLEDNDKLDDGIYIFVKDAYFDIAREFKFLFSDAEFYLYPHFIHGKSEDGILKLDQNQIDTLRASAIELLKKNTHTVSDVFITSVSENYAYYIHCIYYQDKLNDLPGVMDPWEIHQICENPLESEYPFYIKNNLYQCSFYCKCDWEKQIFEVFKTKFTGNISFTRSAQFSVNSDLRAFAEYNMKLLSKNIDHFNTGFNFSKSDTGKSELEYLLNMKDLHEKYPELKNISIC